MADPLINEEIAHEVYEAGKADRKARAEAEAESRENAKTGTLISTSLITGMSEKTNFKKFVGADGEVKCKIVGRNDVVIPRAKDIEKGKAEVKEEKKGE